ncbi:MAG: hypothetical protein IJV43_04965 [Oscillospiraceae bacterium]|nr:hypothetical protein [Oscillospiraceae bacterium]
MKRFFALLAAALLLTGCAAERADSRVSDLQRAYAATGGCDARVEVAVSDEEETRRYTLDVAKDGDKTRVTVLEPEALAGVAAAVSGDALALEFDGMVLDAGGAGSGVSAVNATEIVLRAAASGYVTERNSERYADTDALRLCFETEQNGEMLYVTAYFDAANAPLYAEIARDGKVLAYLEFTDFAFHDIIPASGYYN